MVLALIILRLLGPYYLSLDLKISKLLLLLVNLVVISTSKAL
jgi:hypothetical protein